MNFIKHSSIKFSYENNLMGKEVNFEKLLKAARRSGYIVMYYSTSATQLILLNLYERARNSRSVCCKDQNGNVCIFIDDSLAGSEKLFALAHEIGHVVLEHKAVETEEEKERQENEANLFAHHLLMESHPYKLKCAIKNLIEFFITVAFLVAVFIK